MRNTPEYISQSRNSRTPGYGIILLALGKEGEISGEIQTLIRSHIPESQLIFRILQCLCVNEREIYFNQNKLRCRSKIN